MVALVRRIAFALSLGTVAASAHAATSCSDLTGVSIADTRIVSAQMVAPGAIEATNVSADVSFCRVKGVAHPSSDSEIKFEVWLPATAGQWTHRLKVNGTGGYAGAIPFARLAQDVGDGFVTAGSNMGHDGGESPAWTLNHPEKVKDWGLRAHYSVSIAAKSLAKALYGKPVKYSYFEGCSNGGRQALMMAQNYPQLFDGIVAGAPSNFYPDLLMWLLWSGKQLTPSAPFGPPSISEEKRRAVTAHVMAACDALDGAADGQITDPRACHFDIDTLGPSGDGTLTGDEIAVFKAMYSGTVAETGERRYAGARLGSESDWIPLFADQGGYGNFIGHFVYSSASFDWRKQANLFSAGYDQVKTALSPVTAAPSPDLRAFRAHGGKLIQFHGWNDAVVPPDGSIGYFHALTQFESLKNLPDRMIDARVDQLTTQDIAAASEKFGDQVRAFHRLFLLPAVGHCGGSTGPSTIGGGAAEPPKAFRKPETHVVSALMKWVERGVPPAKLVASSFDTAGNPTRQRPVCPYPQQAVYLGKGSFESADSFKCAVPAGAVDEVEAGDLIYVRNALRQRHLMLPHR